MKEKDMDELVFLWEEYGKEKEKKLTLGGISLKNDVRCFVSSLPDLPEGLRH